MGKTQLVIMAEGLLIGIFARIAQNLGEAQALAALHADMKETEAQLAHYRSARRRTGKGHERAYFIRNLIQRLGFLAAIETKIREGVFDEDPEEDDEEDEPLIPFDQGPWLCWSNPTKVKSVA